MDAAVLDASPRAACRQTVLRVETGRGPVVIKSYASRRTRLRRALRQIGHWTFAGKSATGPLGRRRTESACLRLWREHGFDAMREVEFTPPSWLTGPYLALEYLDGRTMREVLRDPNVPEAEKLDLLGCFAATWSKRHAAALRHREPRLLHEHGTFGHIFVTTDRLVGFDLETAWTRHRRTPYLVGREIASFLRSLGRASTPEQFSTRLEVIVRAYDAPEQWNAAISEVLRSRSPFLRTVNLLERLKRRTDPYAPRRALTAAAAMAATVCGA